MIMILLSTLVKYAKSVLTTKCLAPHSYIGREEMLKINDQTSLYAEKLENNSNKTTKK